MEPSWSLDYCLACDKQTSEGAYCSQRCRLLDVASGSKNIPPPSPTRDPMYSNTTTGQAPGFHLPPAFDFAAYRTRVPSLPHAFDISTQKLHPVNTSKPPAQPQVVKAPSSPRALTPSSSQTSLASMKSTSSNGESVSEQVLSELRSYTNSFDQVRDWKRRMTSA